MDTEIRSFFSVVNILLCLVAIILWLNFANDENICPLLGPRSTFSNHFCQVFGEGCLFVFCMLCTGNASSSQGHASVIGLFPCTFFSYYISLCLLCLLLTQWLDLQKGRSKSTTALKRPFEQPVWTLKGRSTETKTATTKIVNDIYFTICSLLGPLPGCLQSIVWTVMHFNSFLDNYGKTGNKPWLRINYCFFFFLVSCWLLNLYISKASRICTMQQYLTSYVC